MTFLSFLGAPESPFQAPGLLWHFFSRPIHFTLTYIHAFLVRMRGGIHKTSSKDIIRIVCISDTHTNKPDIPQGDLLIHAGDLTNDGTVSEIQEQIDWLANQPHQYVVAISGNHDSYFDPKSRKREDKGKRLDFKRVKYLQHSGTTLKFPAKGDRKLTVYGAPQIPECGGSEHAFQYRRQDDAWSDTLPGNIDILVTHTPPRWHLDLPWGMGCDYLLKEIWRVEPELHVFGHIHAGHGYQRVYWDDGQRAFERAMSRQSLMDLINPLFWLDCVQVIFYDVAGILWNKVWGAESQTTMMVNSGVVDYYGKLVYSARVIEL